MQRVCRALTTALIYGFLASAGLVVGAGVGMYAAPPRRAVASVVAFGSGVLVSTLTFDLMDEAFEREGGAMVALATAVGFISALLLSRLTQ